MARWISYRHDGRPGFGRIDGDRIEVHAGDLFDSPCATGETLALSEVTVALPCRPSKLIALWNNFAAMAEKQGLEHPPAPLLFIKPPNSYHPHGAAVAIPAGVGKLLFEGELGIVIGRRGRDLTEAHAAEHIFGYTVLNDVTSLDILRGDASFMQWTRSKGLDGFSPMGPCIATGIDPMASRVRVRIDGTERQNYPLADMIRKPAELVAMLSRGMTLEPGDVIACGTSVGVGSIPPGATVEVEIDDIGILSNRFEA